MNECRYRVKRGKNLEFWCQRLEDSCSGLAGNHDRLFTLLALKIFKAVYPVILHGMGLQKIGTFMPFPLSSRCLRASGSLAQSVHASEEL